MALPRPSPRLLFMLVAAAAALAAAASATAMQHSPRLTMPALTGPDKVGTIVHHLIDRSRPDPSFRSGHRELMVQVWYPADAGRGAYAPYMPRGAATIMERVVHVPAGTVSRIRTRARLAAPAAAGRHPVLLFSPGSTEMRSDATALVENLASEGFVVITIDHTHESQLVAFPDGQIVRGTFVDTGPASNLRAVRVRVADVRFVLDQLASLDRRGLLARRLDLTRVGMFGFSLGGATAAAAMLADPRLKAGADLDGSIYGPVIQAGLHRPFLLMLSPIPTQIKQRCGAPCKHLSEFHFYRAFYAHLRGPRYAIELKDSGHESFEDAVWIKPQLEAIAPTVAKQFQAGRIDAHTAVATVSSYLTAFFDRYLRGTPQPLLSDPSATYPALRILR
jgi:dienelactone hydrolase